MAKTITSKTAEISFGKKIYKAAAVRKALEEYSGAAQFDVSENKNEVRVVVSGIPPGQYDELTGEFCNYVLYLTKIMQGLS